MNGCTLNLLPFAEVAGVCDHCGKALTGRQQRWCSRECSFVEWPEHDWNSARKAAKKRDGHRCVQCGSGASLEVNHIEPRVGKGYGWGCWNHQDNLETLCHDCHVAVTNAQRAERRAGYRADARAREDAASGASPLEGL